MSEIRSIGVLRVVGDYVELAPKGGGRDYWGLCPFHGEKSPSFKVDPDRGFYKCFGCDAKGDGITFVMRYLGFAYLDALLFIAEKYNIDVVYDNKGFESTKDILSLHNDLQLGFRASLYEEGGLDAKNYILNRSFNESALELFGVGYIPPRFNFSTIFKKYDKEILLASGFFKESKDGKYINSRFFNRLSLPIRSVTGSISAFAGRSIDGSEPKYLNSADSEVFHKGELLFNIDKAKDSIRSSKTAILVEGYFDVMRLYLSGHKNVVAPMGTALTKNQVALVKRYADDVVVIFDGDEAGLKAAQKSLPLFISASVSPKIVLLNKEDDPDSMILNKGVDHFNAMYEKREDLFIYMIKRAFFGCRDDFSVKSRRFKSIHKMLLGINDLLMRDYYINHAADIFGFNKDRVREIVELELNENAISSSRGAGSKERRKDSNSNAVRLCERDFLTALICLDIDVVDSLLMDIEADMFQDEDCKSFFTLINKELPNLFVMDDLVLVNMDDNNFFYDLKSRKINGDVYRMAVENKDRIISDYQMSLELESSRKSNNEDDIIESLIKVFDNIKSKNTQQSIIDIDE